MIASDWLHELRAIVTTANVQQVYKEIASFKGELAIGEEIHYFIRTTELKGKQHNFQAASVSKKAISRPFARVVFPCDTVEFKVD